MRIHQHDYRPAAGPHPPGTTTSAIIGGATFTGLVPANDPVVQAGFLILGTITLPLRWLPPDNQSAYYTVSVDSDNRSDRFMDLLLLDQTGQTVLIVHDHDGFTNYFIDEPAATQGLGGILGSNAGRTQARSVTERSPGCPAARSSWSPARGTCCSPTQPTPPGRRPSAWTTGPGGGSTGLMT